MEETLLWWWWWGGAFANCKVGDLHQVKGKLSLTGYHSIMQHHTIPSGTRLVGQGLVLIQDNDPKNTSKFCQRCIKNKEEQHVFQLMSWPAQPADLNPIEPVGDELNLKVRAKQATRVAHLMQLLSETWAELSSVYHQSLVKRMPRICEAVIVTKVGTFWWIRFVIFLFVLFVFNVAQEDLYFV